MFKYKNKFKLILLLAFALFIPMSGSVAAHEHHGGDNHGGNYHHGGYYGNGGYYGGGSGFGVFIDPYSYYYYPGNTYVVVPSGTHQHHSSTAKAKPTASQIEAMKVQVELTSLGYYKGEIDGDIGPASTAALKAFQHDRGLSETGAINDATLKSLGVTQK